MLLAKKSMVLVRTLSSPKLIVKNRSLTTAQSLIETVRRDFEKENVPEIQSSIEIILSHVLNERNLDNLRKNASKIELNEEQKAKFLELCEVRKARMPVQYIIKEWDFRNLRMKVVPPVFIPRPETEELVELVLQQLNPSGNYKILDCCCGAGAISLSILKAMPKVHVTALDVSELACKLTRENAKDLNLQDRLRVFRHKLVDENLPQEIHEDGKFDLIVSNPPYVKTDDLMKLDHEVKIYEDLRALDGGPDGLNIIKILIKTAAKLLKPNGSLWLETDPSHPEMIAKIIEENPDLNLKFIATYKDIFQKERFVEIDKLE